MMKKLLIFVCSFILVLSLTACSGNNNTANDNTTTDNPSNGTVSNGNIADNSVNNSNGTDYDTGNNDMESNPSLESSVESMVSDGRS